MLDIVDMLDLELVELIRHEHLCLSLDTNLEPWTMRRIDILKLRKSTIWTKTPTFASTSVSQNL